MSYPEGEMNPDQKEHLRQERRRFSLDPTNPEVSKLHALNLAFAKRTREMSDEQIAAELTLRMLQLSHTDSMTHLPDKEGLKIELKSAMEVAKTFGLLLTVLYIDGDNFKSINDNFDRAVGDRVIQAIADGIRDGTRRWTDIEGRMLEETDNQETAEQTARPGGDEFAVILLETDLEGAEVVAEHIQTEVTKLVAERVPEVRGFTVTIGKAQYDPNIDNDEIMLLKRADQDLTAQRHARGQTRRS